MSQTQMMHGWMLYTGQEIPELTRACQEAGAAGVRLEVVDPKDVELVLDPEAPTRLRHKGIEVAAPMFAVAAFVEEADAYNLALLQQLETQGVLCVNRAETLKRTGDKLLTLQLLAAAGLPVPRTILVRPETSPAFIRETLGLPVVIKVLDGSKGHGVSLIHSEKELETLLEMLDAARCQSALLAQEFIADSRGRDLRVLVIDGRPQVCMLRQNRSSEGFKSNVSAGGSANDYPMSEAIRELSQQVIDIIGLNIGGIDLLFKGDGFVVGEANSMPGFQGIESCNTLNVPAEILKSIGRQLQARAKARFRRQAEALRSLDELRGKSEPELVQLFMGACGSVERIQQQVLLDILQRNAHTEFGQAHGFDAIRSVAEFRRRVPVREWPDVAPDALRLEQGAKDLLFAGQPTHFISTTGTTGAFKNIPESAEGEFAKSLVSRIRTALLIKLAPELLDGFFIPLSNPAVLGQTACGIPVGFASGLTLAGTSPEIQRRLAFPPAVLQAPDRETLDYLILRFALAKPEVRLLVGNNPGRMTALLETADQHRDRLIDDIAHGTLSAALPLASDLRATLERDLSPDPERARALRDMAARRGRLEPRDYWPNLRVISCWLGGTIGRYLEGLRPLLPENVLLVDCGYGASEGKFNVPMKPGVSAGPLAVFGYFLEFQPLDGGEPLLAHELEDGQEYGLIVTSYSGLYRYNLHDIVRVSGFTDQNPNIAFVSKTRDVANLAGEKLSGAFLSEILSRTLAEHQVRWRHFCLVADADQHRYAFCIESEGTPPEARWLADMEQALVAQAEPYRLLRGQELLQPPHLVLMKTGWLDRLYEERLRPGVTTAQIKLPMICESVPCPDMIERVLELS